MFDNLFLDVSLINFTTNILRWIILDLTIAKLLTHIYESNKFDKFDNFVDIIDVKYLSRYSYFNVFLIHLLGLNLILLPSILLGPWWLFYPVYLTKFTFFSLEWCNSCFIYIDEHYCKR